MKNAIAIVKIMLLSGVPPEPLKGSVARRIKTWLRSTMTQRMFNALAIVNSKRSCR